jgi:hypothetical protein
MEQTINVHFWTQQRERIPAFGVFASGRKS